MQLPSKALLALAVAAAAGATGSLVVAGLHGGGWLSVPVWAVSAGSLLALLVFAGLAIGSSPWARKVSLSLCVEVVLGLALVFGLSVFQAGPRTAHEADFGFLLALVAAGWTFPPTYAALAALRAPTAPRSRDFLDRTLWHMGLWTAAIAALCLAALALGPTMGGLQTLALAAVDLLAVTCGALAANAGWARQRRRRQWLTNVQAGLEPDWVTLPEKRLAQGNLDHVPFLLYETTSRAAQAVIARRRTVPAGAYRTTELLTPWARL